MLRSILICSLMLFATGSPAEEPDAVRVTTRFNVPVPLRDGVTLNATVYTPKDQSAPAACVFTLTPYVSDTYSERGIYFAAHGYPFATVDVRGRGDSQGTFTPFAQEAKDGYDVVEWLAGQSWCNGRVAMWGGSYAGYDQWATAKERPPHLASIVPAAAAQPGVDFPFGNNLFYTYDMQWLTFVTGRALQSAVFGNSDFWRARYAEWFESGRSLRELDQIVGNPSPIFQEWLSHPQQGPYWDAMNPTPEEYAALDLPILTITGSYDADQPGALAFYRQHQQHGNAQARERHYLIIGPWDHAGTRTPNKEVGGLTFGDASMVDLPKLHTEWYAWTMGDGPKPAFLQKRVAYYVIAQDQWRYADTLEGITAEHRPLYLASRDGVANDPLHSGTLDPEAASGTPDRYVYDPRDTSIATVLRTLDSESLIDQRMVFANGGRELVYHSAPFTQDTEVSGTFRLSAWISLDQPDTDFIATVYEILPDGSSVVLTSDVQRARYRESLREGKPVPAGKVLRYEFDRFTFMSRLVRKGSRLRLVIAPPNSIYWERNYNTGGVVAEESMKDARTVTVTLVHDRAHPSALFVPIAAELPAPSGDPARTP